MTTFKKIFISNADSHSFKFFRRATGARMWLSRNSLQRMASVLGACIVAYFLYHTIQGDRGWLAMLRLQNQVTVAHQNLSQLQQEHRELEHRVSRMRPGSLDPDLLDEQARHMLDYSKPNEIVVLIPSGENADLSQRSK